jgi:hypothetical protein
MTKFWIVEPGSRISYPYTCKHHYQAVEHAGLETLHVDHGTVAHDADSGGIAIIVFETGLYSDPAIIPYFTIGGRLYAGNAVLYGYDAAGETIDLSSIPPIKFYSNKQEIETDIDAGLVTRPMISIGNHVVWRWPDPPVPLGPIGARLD